MAAIYRTHLIPRETNKVPKQQLTLAADHFTLAETRYPYDPAVVLDIVHQYTKDRRQRNQNQHELALLAAMTLDASEDLIVELRHLRRTERVLWVVSAMLVAGPFLGIGLIDDSLKGMAGYGIVLVYALPHLINHFPTLLQQWTALTKRRLFRRHSAAWLGRLRGSGLRGESSQW